MINNIPWEILPFMDQALREFWDEDGDEGFCFGNRGDDTWVNEEDDDEDNEDDEDDEEGWY